MIKTATISIREIKEKDRFEPEYWVIGNFINSILKKYDYKNLEEYSKFIRKGIFDLKAERYQDSGIPFLRISNLKFFELSNMDLVYISEEDNKLNNKTVLRQRDIAFSKIGTLGKVLRIGKRFSQVNISQNLIGVSLKEDKDKNFIFAYLLSKLALLQLKKNRKRQLQDKLNLNDIKNIAVVELPENKKDKIDKLIEEAEYNANRANSLIEEARKIFYQSCSIDFLKIKKEKFYSVNLSYFKKSDLWIPKYSYPLYVETLNQIKKKLKVVKLNDIAKIKNGDETGSDSYNLYLDKKITDIPFIRTSDLINYEVDQFPDYYIPKEIYSELNQDIKPNEILFTKDGKVGLTAMVSKNDKAIISSGISRITLKEEAKKYDITPEYLFLMLSIKEIGSYQADKMTVIASTLPHLKEDNLGEFEIPILDKNSILKITNLIKKTFDLKDKKKQIIKQVIKEVDDYFNI